MTGLYSSNLEGKNRGKRKLSEKQDDVRTRGGHSEEEDMTDAPRDIRKEVCKREQSHITLKQEHGQVLSTVPTLGGNPFAEASSTPPIVCQFFKWPGRQTQTLSGEVSDECTLHRGRC